MAIPACLNLPDLPEQLVIEMPGGAAIASLTADIERIPSASQVVMNLMAQAGPAMAPLKPFFDVLGTVVQIKACVEAVPDSISQLSPGPLLSCIPELAEKVAQLLKLIPQLSIPFTIVSFLDAVIAALDGLVSALEEIVRQAENLAERLEAASTIGDPNLDAILECSQTDLEKQTTGAIDGLQGLAPLIDIINIFMGLLGLPEISFDIEAPEEIAGAIDTINDLIDLLRSIRDAVPVP